MRKKAQFGQVVSGYVDPTPEGLNMAYQRHMDNLITSEQVRQQAAMLKAAPFEGDQQMRRDLLDNTNQTLENIVSKGAYGNLSNFTGAVTRASTEFAARKNPIETNYTAYQEYNKQLADFHEKGDLDAEDVNGNLFLSTQGYKGLQYDADGNATGFFKGRTIYKNPDIQKMINEALSKIHADGSKIVKKLVGQGPGGMYTIETTEGIEEISADKVDAALQSVYNDPRVTGYLGRKAEIRTAQLPFTSDDPNAPSVQGALEKRLKALQGDVEISDDATDEEKAQARILQAKRLEEAGELTQLLQSGDEEKMRMRLRGEMTNDMLNTYRSSALNQAGYRITAQGYKEGYDKKGLIDYKAALDASMAAEQAASGLVITENAITYEAIGGENAHDFNIAIKQDEDLLKTLMTQMAEDGENMSETQRAQLNDQIHSVKERIRVSNHMFKDKYGKTPGMITGTEEYAEAKKRNEAWDAVDQSIDSSNYLLGSLDPNYWVASLTNWAVGAGDRRAYRDFMENLGPEYQDPMGGVRRASVEFTDLGNLQATTGVQLPKGIEKRVESHFESFNPEQMVLDTDTGQSITLQEHLAAKGLSPENIDFQSFRVSNMAPLGTGPLAQITYTSGEEGVKKQGTFIMPVGGTRTSTPSQFAIPGLTEVFDTPAMSIISELGLFKASGSKESSWKWRGYNQDGVMSGNMTVDFTTGDNVGGGTVTMKTSVGEQKYGLNDPEFHSILNQYQIRLIN